MKLSERTALAPSTDLDSLDLLDPRLYGSGDPHAIWTTLRERAPVHLRSLPDGRRFWSVTRYHDVREVLRDHTRFTSSRGTLLSVLGGRDPAGGKMMAASDPPVHTMLHEPIARLLSRRALEPFVPKVRQVAHRLLERLADGPRDLAELAAGFPMAFTGTLMGIPEQDWARLTVLTTTAIAPEDPDFRLGNRLNTLATAHHELFSYFSRRARRASREDGLIGALLGVEVGGRGLRHDELVYNCYSLLLGANVTTPHAVTQTVLAFIENPGEYRKVVDDPGLVSGAVEEGLRWSSPANHFLRHAAQDTTLRGRQVREGDAVVTWLGSANRDEEVFSEPFRFDVTRSPNPHVAFGFGPHHCVGAALARMALNALFAEIAGSVERFDLAGPVEHLASDFAAGIKHMPVVTKLRTA
ncbi:cytochrome P450 [Streptomyces echinatus]|uniref:Cytochrome P450 n=1 Tax=Streptomyces echinatus TaxID=67293 RepID=A0A7W9Q2B1_9ACTN|nr:cytochrome P450 [Streptomyces echinatus]MBB5932046.1 cytochrome P450 [Streptomyces echinatus]